MSLRLDKLLIKIKRTKRIKIISLLARFIIERIRINQAIIKW